jgi:adhesin HecA-like repeat protein
MPYTNDDSWTATDANNVLRGLYQDNTNHAVTGTTDETTLATVSVTGGTITATGALHVVASGTITNSASGAKTVKLYLGGTAVATVSRTGANAQDWIIDAWCFNTAAATQRWCVTYSTTDAATCTYDYTTSAIDTASAATLKVTGTLAAAGDTITGTVFLVKVIQPA